MEDVKRKIRQTFFFYVIETELTLNNGYTDGVAYIVLVSDH